jgi:hypothetical protein
MKLAIANELTTTPSVRIIALSERQHKIFSDSIKLIITLN